MLHALKTIKNRLFIKSICTNELNIKQM